MDKWHPDRQKQLPLPAFRTGELFQPTEFLLQSYSRGGNLRNNGFGQKIFLLTYVSPRLMKQHFRIEIRKKFPAGGSAVDVLCVEQYDFFFFQTKVILYAAVKFPDGFCSHNYIFRKCPNRRIEQAGCPIDEIVNVIICIQIIKLLKMVAPQYCATRFRKKKSVPLTPQVSFKTIPACSATQDRVGIITDTSAISNWEINISYFFLSTIANSSLSFN